MRGYARLVLPAPGQLSGPDAITHARRLLSQRPSIAVGPSESGDGPAWQDRVLGQALVTTIESRLLVCSAMVLAVLWGPWPLHPGAATSDGDSFWLRPGLPLQPEREGVANNVDPVDLLLEMLVFVFEQVRPWGPGVAGRLPWHSPPPFLCLAPGSFAPPPPIQHTCPRSTCPGLLSPPPLPCPSHLPLWARVV